MALRTTTLGRASHTYACPSRLGGLLVAALALALAGCAAGPATPPIAPSPPPDFDPELGLAEYERLFMPQTAKVLEWTKPISLAADGSADAVDAIVEVRDGTNEQTKVVGVFHFELQSRRASDRMGERVGFWSVAITDERMTQTYRDPLSRYYHFPLRLEQSPLPAGRYVLGLTLHLPGGKRIFSEYEFEYAGGAAPPPSVF